MRAIEIGMHGPVELPTLPLCRAVTEVSGLMEQSSFHKHPHTSAPEILAATTASSICGAQGQLEGHYKHAQCTKNRRCPKEPSCGVVKGDATKGHTNTSR